MADQRKVNRMEHFYQRVPGMFNFQDLYKRMVREAESPAHFVEVGAFLGKSASFMAVEIINSGKQIIFDVVDTFEGSPQVKEERKFTNEVTGDYYSQFLSNIKPACGYIRPFPMTSRLAAERYKILSLDFVYIDASHDYKSVQADINAWYPKVKPGGYIGGHDYRSNCPGVWRAVNERFGRGGVEQIGTSWLKQI